jgi:acyl-CoA reductase-like NAD-dependent aldehyde dehydrogenase
MADPMMLKLETFGPVTCVYRFESLDDAIEIVNSLPVAFQASVFSTDIGPALQAAKRLDASAVMINDHTAVRTDWMPFAGRRQSGYGVGGILATIDEMSQEKMPVSGTRTEPHDWPVRPSSLSLVGKAAGRSAAGRRSVAMGQR